MPCAILCMFFGIGFSLVGINSAEGRRLFPWRASRAFLGFMLPYDGELNRLLGSRILVYC